MIFMLLAAVALIAAVVTLAGLRMANLTVSTLPPTSPRAGRESYTLTNALQVFAGSLLCLDTTTGLVIKPTDAATCKFLGLALTDALGNTGVTPPVEVRINTEGEILRNQTIATFATQAKVGSLVFNATTDNPADFTTVAATNMKAVGVAVRFVSAGVGDVKLFTPAEHLGL
jgi:hypothetical protein